MDDGDKRAFAETIQALAVNFRQEATTPLLQAMWMGLEDLPMPAFLVGAKRALREAEFMPTVAELRKLAGHGKRESLPPYLKRWRDPLALPAMHPRDTWPKEGE